MSKLYDSDESADLFETNNEICVLDENTSALDSAKLKALSSLNVSIAASNCEKYDVCKDNPLETSYKPDEVFSCITDNENEKALDMFDLSHNVGSEDKVVNTEHGYMNVKCLESPKLVANICSIYKTRRNNFLRGCQWSPDGTCLLANSSDNILRIFELPRFAYDTGLYDASLDVADLAPVLEFVEYDQIYDYCWYPFMNSSYPDTCFFASSSRRNAVCMFDAYTGKERSRIQLKNHLEEAVSAHSLAFSRDGYKLYCGFDRFIQVCDITRPKDVPIRRPSLGMKSELRGIISCIATSPVNIGLYACGSYSKDAAVFHENTGDQMLEFLRAGDRIGGITHIEFSPVDINVLVTGSRIDCALHVWDLRNPGSPMYATARRDVRTNQCIQFAFDRTGRYIITGNHSGTVSTYDIRDPSAVDEQGCIHTVAEWRAHGDVCNGLSIHPYLPVMATAAGQRRLVPPWQRLGMQRSRLETDYMLSDDSSDWSSDDESVFVDGSEENSLKIWSFPSLSTQ